jgi:hypothetical protein
MLSGKSQNQAKQETSKKQALLAAFFIVVLSLVYSSITRIEMVCSSETSVDIHEAN